MGPTMRQFCNNGLQEFSNSHLRLDVNRCCVHYNAACAPSTFGHSSERIVCEISPPLTKERTDRV